MHIEPDEDDALARIPSSLLFPAPRLPPGHVVLGYDEQGRCPMLVDGACSIYEHRPRTCRTYDCRIFAAAGVAPDDEEHAPLAARAARWQFDHVTERDAVLHDAVRAAARFVRERGEALPGIRRPRGSADLAVTAIDVHHVFVGRDPDPEAVRIALGAGRPPATPPG